MKNGCFTISIHSKLVEGGKKTTPSWPTFFPGENWEALIDSHDFLGLVKSMFELEKSELKKKTRYLRTSTHFEICLDGSSNSTQGV